MAKRIVLVLIFAAVVAGGVFAQQGRKQFDLKAGPTPQKNAVFVDFGTTLSYLNAGGFGIGAGYERVFSPKSTVLVNAGFGTVEQEFFFLKYTYTEFGLDVNGRYYFFGTALDKLFVNLGIGVSYRGYDYGASALNSYGLGALIPIYAGWKFIFGKHFVLEPAVGYDIGIVLGEPEYSLDVYSPGGLRIGLRLGWAF